MRDPDQIPILHADGRCVWSPACPGQLKKVAELSEEASVLRCNVCGHEHLRLANEHSVDPEQPSLFL